MNSKRPHAIYSTLQHIFAEIIHVFHFCRFGFFKRLKSSMEILLDGKNIVNQDENKYSKMFRIVTKPGRSTIGHIICHQIQGIVNLMLE